MATVRWMADADVNSRREIPHQGIPPTVVMPTTELASRDANRSRDARNRMEANISRTLAKITEKLFRTARKS